MAHTTNSTADLIDEITHNRNFQHQHGATQTEIFRQDNAERQFNQFMVYMGTTVAPNANVQTLQWWSTEYPDDVMGGIMSNWMLFMIFYRDDNQWGTVSYETMKENMMGPFHEEVRLRFPALASGHFSFARLKARSERFYNTHKWIEGVCGGKGFGSGKVNALVGAGIERLGLSVAWEPHGYRNMSLITANVDIGARHMSLSLTMPQNGFRRPDGAWQLKWVNCKSDPRTNDNNQVLDNEASAWISRFYNTKGMSDFKSTNNFFNLASVCATDKCLNTIGVQAGFPDGGFFSTNSIRSGAATTKVVDLILNGTERGRAIDLVNRSGGWSIGRENVRHYLDWHMVALAEHYEQDPAYTSINDFTLLQLYPELEEINGFLVPDPLTGALDLPGPFRATKFCANSGETEELLDEMDDIWALIRTPNDPQFLGANWSYARKMERIATRLWQNVNVGNFVLPASWNVAVNSLTHTWEGAPNPRSVPKARSIFVNLALRNRFLNAHDLQNQSLPVVPQGMLANLALFQKPPNYDPPKKPKREVNGKRSIDLPSYRQHLRLRRTNKSVAVVSACGEKHRVVELSHAQAVLYKNNQNPPVPAWNFAGTQP